ncbi:hypothetical protein [Patiriisocius marinus]|uniref:Uncharacterized protein n=1 Tax=Patiriisocius marinus TaxID=1397112 RepID=A0A5J4ISG2_9FLAO|nr:hypothetical protein [Patiriisocius marinus]GER60929.1 hypothetical protein ULMA_30370 [Patiriisocius marinus]
MDLSNFRKPLILIILGAALVVIGLVFKSYKLGWGIMQANNIVMLGGIIEVVAAVLAIVILIKMKK